MSTPSPCIILYDANGKPEARPWNTSSLNARFVLEFKRIPYRTIWLEHPEMEPILSSVGAKAAGTNPSDGSPWYTTPVIADEFHPGPDGKPTYVTDPWAIAIAEYLDEKFPDTPRLFPEGTRGLQSLWHDVVTKDVIFANSFVTVPKFYTLLNEESKPYFRQTREGYFKKKLEEMCPKGTQEWENIWKNLEKNLNVLAVALDKNGPQSENPYVLGKVFSYGDIAIGAGLYTLRTQFPEEWENIKTWNNGRWRLIEEKCAVFAKNI